MKLFLKPVEFKRDCFDSLLEFLEEHASTQVFSVSCYKGKLHLQNSVSQALKTFSLGEAIASRPQLEVLVRLSAERQISKALARCKPGKRAVFVSWSANADKDWRDFKKHCDFKEIKLKEPSTEKQLVAIEETATFW